MLIYHPAKDANHCAYRIVTMLSKREGNEMLLDTLRLCDFFYLYPYQLNNITPWPSQIKKFKKYVKKLTKSFEDMPNPRRVFYDLTDIQNTTLVFLLSKNIICGNSYKNQRIELLMENVPSELVKSMDNDGFVQTEIFQLIVNGLPGLKFKDGDSLKKRTDLMEYRYD